MEHAQLYSWNEVAREQMNPWFARQVIHTERMTIAQVFLSKGGLVPDHHHENEQVTVMMTGSLKFSAEGKDLIVSAGEVLRIPPNLVHRFEALEDSIAFDLFAPPREDWQRGDDAYLRQAETA